MHYSDLPTAAATCGEAREKARQMHSSFLQAYPQVDPVTFPLLRLSPENWDNPFGGCPNSFSYCERSSNPSFPNLHATAREGAPFCDRDADCVGDQWCVDEELVRTNSCVREP